MHHFGPFWQKVKTTQRPSLKFVVVHNRSFLYILKYKYTCHLLYSLQLHNLQRQSNQRTRLFSFPQKNDDSSSQTTTDYHSGIDLVFPSSCYDILHQGFYQFNSIHLFTILRSNQTIHYIHYIHYITLHQHSESDTNIPYNKHNTQ